MHPGRLPHVAHTFVRRRSLPVYSEAKTHRRGFLGKIAGAAAAAAGISVVGTRAMGEEGTADAWIHEVKGTHRCLFDFPQHKNGFPLLHILNYLNTYATAYK